MGDTVNGETNEEDTMATSTELRDAANAARAAKDHADELTAAARKAERQERRAKAAKEAAEHYTRMYEEIGQPLAGLNEAQHGIVYSQAYEQGHASGYQEMENYYGDYAEMARKLLAAQ